MGYTMYEQGWKHEVLGAFEPNELCKNFGWEVTCLAQAFTVAGRAEGRTPHNLLNRFNHLQMWTQDGFEHGPGLIDWGRLGEAYPEINWGGTKFTIVFGSWGRHLAAMLEYKDENGNSVVFNPYTGLNEAPVGFHRTALIRTFDINL